VVIGNWASNNRLLPGVVVGNWASNNRLLPGAVLSHPHHVPCFVRNVKEPVSNICYQPFFGWLYTHMYIATKKLYQNFKVQSAAFWKFLIARILIFFLN
jgi:hypothetical protein